MKKICILGPVDKRVITYPLIKVLELTGKTLVITDDSCFRRFDDYLGVDFSNGQVRFIIKPVISEKTVAEVGLKEEDFDFVLYISTNELIQDCDATVYAHGVNKSMLSDDNMEFLEELQYTEVIITPNKVVKNKDSEEKTNSAVKIDVMKDMLHYVFTCEENRMFMHMTKPGSLLPKFIASIFKDNLGIPADTVAKLLERRES